MHWLTFALSAALVVAGLIVALTVGSLLGPVLILGGMAGFVGAMVPYIIDRVVQFLSTGSLRRRR